MNKRTILAAVVAAVLALAACASALAADDTEVISIRFVAGAVSISVAPSDWDITGVMPNSQYTTPADHFTIRNSGYWSVTTKIRAADATGDMGASWTLSPAAVPGPDRYGLLYTTNGTDYDPITPSQVNFIPLTSGASQTFGLRALTPTNSGCIQPSEVVTTTITISAYRT